MSLKAFHIAFILISTAFAIGFGLWGVRDYVESHSTFNLALGIASLVTSLGLVWYGTWFLSKYKKYSYL